MLGCSQCSTDNLRSEKQIEMEMEMVQIGWDGTKARRGCRKPYLGTKIRRTLEKKKKGRIKWRKLQDEK